MGLNTLTPSKKCIEKRDFFLSLLQFYCSHSHSQWSAIHLQPHPTLPGDICQQHRHASAIGVRCRPTNLGKSLRLILNHVISKASKGNPPQKKSPPKLKESGISWNIRMGIIIISHCLVPCTVCLEEHVGIALGGSYWASTCNTM